MLLILRPSSCCCWNTKSSQVLSELPAPMFTFPAILHFFPEVPVCLKGLEKCTIISIDDAKFSARYSLPHSRGIHYLLFSLSLSRYEVKDIPMSRTRSAETSGLYKDTFILWRLLWRHKILSRIYVQRWRNDFDLLLRMVMVVGMSLKIRWGVYTQIWETNISNWDLLIY